MGMTIPRHGPAPPPTSGMISLRENWPTAARWRSSHSGNAFHVLPRVTSTAAPPLGSHKRTKAKSRCKDPTSTSASSAAMAGGPLPTHATGMVESATSSLSAVRSRRTSAGGSMAILALQACALANRPSLPELEEELVRRNEERVLLQHPADQHERMRPHDVDYHTSAKFRQIIRTDQWIIVLGRYVVDTCLEFDKAQVIEAWFVEQRPFHMPQKPRERVACGCTRLEHFFD